MAAEVATVNYPDITVGANGVNTATPFSLNANTLTFPGHQARMMLVLTGNGGFADTTYFNVAVGTAWPTIPADRTVTASTTTRT